MDSLQFKLKMIGKLIKFLVSMLIISEFHCAPVPFKNNNSVFGNSSADKLVKIGSGNNFVLFITVRNAFVILRLTLTLTDYIHANLRLLTRANS